MLIDIVRKGDGELMIMEFGDGQVSGLQKVEAKDFYQSFEQEERISAKEFFTDGTAILVGDPIQNKSGVEGIVWNNKLFVTREMTAKFFNVDVRTISRYLEQNGEELSENGYEVLRGKNLKSFLDAARNSGKDINVPTKTTVLGVFDFRAFLNMAMLLSESEKARALRPVNVRCCYRSY